MDNGVPQNIGLAPHQELSGQQLNYYSGDTRQRDMQGFVSLSIPSFYTSPSMLTFSLVYVNQ
jgi:hypothetical protein